MPQDTQARTINYPSNDSVAQSVIEEPEQIQAIDLYLSEPHKPDERMLHVAGEAYHPRSNQYKTFSALIHWRGDVSGRLQQLIDDRLGSEWVVDTWFAPGTPF